MDPKTWASITAWADNVYFHDLPALSLLTYNWIKEWQVLIVGLALLTAGRFYFRRMQRSIEHIRAAVALLAGVEEQVSMKPSHERSSGEEEAPADLRISVLSQNRSSPRGELDFQTGIDELRNAVRAALASIPLSGSIEGKGAELYSKVALIPLKVPGLKCLSDINFFSQWQELQTALHALRAEDVKGADAGQAWERLVDINKLARELRAIAELNSVDTALASRSSGPDRSATL